MWAVVWFEGVSFDGCGKFIWSGGKRMYGKVRAVQNAAVEKWTFADVMCGYNAHEWSVG